MPCLTTVATDVWLDAAGPTPTGLYRYSRCSNSPEVNRLGERLIWGLSFIGIIKRFLFKCGHCDSLLKNSGWKVVLNNYYLTIYTTMLAYHRAVCPEKYVDVFHFQQPTNTVNLTAYIALDNSCNTIIIWQSRCRRFHHSRSPASRSFCLYWRVMQQFWLSYYYH